MEQRPAFKKQLLGLEQDAVFQYIEQMSRTASESEQKLREQIDQVTRSREELEGQIASFEEKLRSVNETLDTEKGKNKKLSEMIGLLQEEIDRQRRQSEAHSREYHAMQEKNRQLSEQLGANRQQREQYDRAVATIGSAILEAKQTAKTIVEQANVQAQQVVEQANSRAQVIEQDTGRFFDSLIERIDGMQQDFMLLHQRMEESVNCLNNRFAQLDEDIAHAREIVLEAKERLGQQGKK